MEISLNILSRSDDMPASNSYATQGEQDAIPIYVLNNPHLTHLTDWLTVTMDSPMWPRLGIYWETRLPHRKRDGLRNCISYLDKYIYSLLHMSRIHLLSLIRHQSKISEAILLNVLGLTSLYEIHNSHHELSQKLTQIK